MTDGRIPLAAVIGSPVAHSLSPALHGFWLRRMGLPGSYIPMDVAHENLREVLRAMPKMGFVGCNVTLPHKETVLGLADVVTDRASLIGAANTLIFREDGSIHADNTDGYGFLENLRQSHPGWRAGAGPAVVLGAGGAARAVLASLLEAGVPEIRLANRTRSRADALRSEFGMRVVVYDWNGIGAAIDDAALLINASSLGMTGKPELRVPAATASPESAGHRSRLQSAADTAPAGGRGSRMRDGRRAGHVAAPGCPGLPALVRRAPGGRRRNSAGDPRVTFRLGLTGSIGMGKSTTARLFAEAGVPVWDADAAVHKLYGAGGAGAKAVAALRPGALKDGAVDRDALKAWVSEDADALTQLERVIHPLVAADRAAFAQSAQSDVVVFDIPLLYETGGDAEMDAVVVVSAPADVQRERVLARAGMSPALLDTILAKQMPDAEKRRRADFVIGTTSLDAAREAVEDVLAQIRRGLGDA